MSSRDLELLERTLELAERGRLGARPNPVVGAVIAGSDGTVLAEGWHARAGEAHAERAALTALGGPPPAGVTLYVSLEPCAHHGRQPPCCEAIVASGIRRVVAACPDSNPQTAGRAAEVFEQAGVQLEWAPEGIADRAAQQNAGIHTHHRSGRPYVTWKWAMSANGRMATGTPGEPWVSSPASRERVHAMRAASGAVAVGIGTVLADDPLLTVRGDQARSMTSPPLRVVFDRQLRLPLGSRLVHTTAEAPTWVVGAPGASSWRALRLRRAGVHVLRVPLDEALAELRVADLLLESGPRLATAWHELGRLDRLTCFLAPAALPADQPGLAEGHPLRRQIEAVGGSPSGVDELREVVLHPVRARPEL